MSNQIITNTCVFSKELDTKKDRNCIECNMLLIPKVDHVHTIERHTRNDKNKKIQLANHYMCESCFSKKVLVDKITQNAIFKAHQQEEPVLITPINNDIPNVSETPKPKTFAQYLLSFLGL